MCTPMFRFLDICNYVSPWDKLCQIMENVRGQALEIMVSLRVVQHCQKVGPLGAVADKEWFSKLKKRDDPLRKRVWGLPANLLGKWDAHICGLVALLKQSGCGALSGSPGVHARLLHGAGNPPFQRCSVAAGGLDEIPPAGHADQKRHPGVVSLRRGGLQNAERSSCQGVKRAKRERVCTNSKTQRCVKEFLAMTPMCCTQAQCWVRCHAARR